MRGFPLVGMGVPGVIRGTRPGDSAAALERNERAAKSAEQERHERAARAVKSAERRAPTRSTQATQHAYREALALEDVNDFVDFWLAVEGHAVFCQHGHEAR